MKVQFFSSIVFIAVFIQSFATIPVWDFNNISIDLLGSNNLYEYTIYNETKNKTMVSLIKKITKNNGNIVSQNYLTVNSTKRKVNFENIDSFYFNKLGYPIIICPKGKYHPYYFANDTYIIPDGFQENGNWDLKCYGHDTGFFLFFYLRNQENNFYYSLNNKIEFDKCMYCFGTYIYDFMIENGLNDEYYSYKFPVLMDEENNLFLRSKTLNLDSQDYRLSLGGFDYLINIIQIKNNVQAYFDKDNTIYYFSYNTIFDFISGYIINKFNLTGDSELSCNNSEINKNTESPFKSFDTSDNIQIQEINFIRGTNLVYYNIYYSDNNKHYYGLIDIKLNKILYNIENEFTSFLPYSRSEMLAITSSSAYLICIAKNGNSCTKTCPYDILKVEKEGNTCTGYCDPDKIMFIPSNICINKEECDLNIYTLNNDENQCGLCNYFYPSDKKYKLINTSYCLSYIPNNTEFYNEESLILKCKDNYHLTNNSCIPDSCYESCETCFSIYEDANNQHCLTCKEGFTLNNGNCISDSITCPEGSFLDENNICNNCTNQCKNYVLNSCNCSACHNGYYVENELGRCRQCGKVCDEYGENNCDCLSCPVNYELEDTNCVECTGCKTSEISSCDCSICLQGYYLDNNKCKQCDEECLNYQENTCNCDNNNIYYFNGYYYKVDGSINLLQTDNLTNIEDRIFQIIKNKLSNGEINLSYLDSGKYFYAEALKTKFTIYKTEGTEENDLTTKIDLGECGDKLKADKGLSESISLYILNIEKSQDGMKISKTGYEVYYYNSDNNAYEKMDIGVCKDMKISKSVYVNISEDEIDKYNSSSDYYNDICYTYTSDNGTDVTLTDRRNEYVDNNMAVCEEDCDFLSYDSKTGEAICSCSVIDSLSAISDMKFDKEKLKSNFINFKNIANINMLKCYHLLFSSKIIKNIGCIIITIIILAELTNMIIFYSFGYNLFSKKIIDIVEVKVLESKSNDINIHSMKGNKDKINNNSSEKEIRFESEFNVNKKNSKKGSIKSMKKKRKSKNRKSEFHEQKKSQNPPKKVSVITSASNIKESTSTNKINNLRDSHFFKKMQSTSNKYLTSFDNLNVNEKNNLNNKKNKNDKQGNNILKYIDIELNLLPYQEALDSDKRTFCQYYFSLMMTKHLLVFSFFNRRDYNSTIIKINLFLFTFSVNYTVNALFFNDSTMHEIYSDGGEFDFIYQIPQILYSSIISSVLILLVKFLALSEKNVLKIKNAKKEELTQTYKSESKKIKIKFLIFFIITFIFSLVFWYYVGCFCAVYKNTQIHLLTDTLISFATSLSYPLLLYLLPGIFRISSLKDKKKKSECRYNFSKIIQFIV